MRDLLPWQRVALACAGVFAVWSAGVVCGIGLAWLLLRGVVSGEFGLEHRLYYGRGKGSIGEFGGVVVEVQVSVGGVVAVAMPAYRSHDIHEKSGKSKPCRLLIPMLKVTLLFS